MAIFCFKKLEETVTIGQLFRRAREQRKMSLTELAAQLRLSPRYITALEENAFARLPKSRLYRLAYVKQLAEFLRLSSEECVTRLTQQGGLDGLSTLTKLPTKLSKIPFGSISLLVKNSLIAGFVVLFVGYSINQVNTLLKPPALSLFSPNEGEITGSANTLIQGSTEPETKLLVNGQDIVVNEKGHFSLTINLAQGLNTITVVAAKKHGSKTSSLTRHVVLKKGLGTVSLGDDSRSKN